MTEEYDVTQPILILVRRGRGDRGYLVAAVDDASNPFPCADEGEVGSAIVELLNDPKQPRFDEKQLEAAAADYEDDEEDDDEEDDIEDDEDEEEYEEEDEDEPPPPPDPLDELGLDPGEKLLFKIGETLLGKARHVSNDYRDKRKKRKKKKKKKKRRA